MQTLFALLLVAVAAIAGPGQLGSSAAPTMPQLPNRMGRQPSPIRSDYIIPRMLMPNPYGYQDRPGVVAPIEQDWLSKEIERINEMEDDDEDMTPFAEKFSRWMSRAPYIPRSLVPAKPREPAHNTLIPRLEEVPLPPPKVISAPKFVLATEMATSTLLSSAVKENENEEKKKTFALTPLDKEYFEPVQQVVMQKFDGSGMERNQRDGNEGGESKSNNKAVNVMAFQQPRQTRQNPNLGRTKNLVAENLDGLRVGLTQQNLEGTDEPSNVQVLETTAEPAVSIFSIVYLAAWGTILAIATIGISFGLYRLEKKDKAAADVDYPAYGVTGPNIDTSGDRKLAHSAHMYHYQHQKQQIIAMERNGCELGNGSMSEPDSEEENEEGDYTVYECPGFATTGEIEVKNPLFSEEPNPAIPGKCEKVKPQPKETKQ